MTVRLESEFMVKTQQTPKPAAQEPLEDPPLDEHSLYEKSILVIEIHYVW